MAEIGFYHLLRTPLERALPKLLEAALARGMRALVVTGSDERARQLNEALWTWDPASFLPHGAAEDGDAERQPVWLAAREDNLNGANLLVLIDGADSDRPEAWERVVDLFDGHDEAAVRAARQRWTARRQAGHSLTYWRQTEGGGWRKEAGA